MNASYRPSAEFVQLIARQFDDQISAQEERRLSELLKSDRDARDYYCRLIQVHGVLEWENCSLRTPSPPALPVATAPSPFYRGIVYLSDPLRFGLVVASVVCVSLILTFAQVAWERDPAPAVAKRAVGVPSSAPVKLVSSHGAWANAAGDEVPTRLAQGEAVELATGRAELSFAAGAKITLLAPARLALQGPSTVALQSGKLFAQVSPRGRGFTVVTPLTRLVDLGTEFAVSVAAEGRTFVQVRSGEVEVNSLPSADKPFSTLLAAGQARQIVSHAGQVRIETVAADAELFAALQNVRIALAANQADATAGRNYTIADYKLVRIGGRTESNLAPTRGAVFPFRLPAAMKNQRVLAAKFSFTITRSNGAPFDFQADLYGLPVRPAPDLKRDNAYFVGPFGTDPQATPLAANIFNSPTDHGRRTIESPQLVDYLNAQRQSGAADDQYVFLRINPDREVPRESGIWIAAAEHPDPHVRPVLELVLEGERSAARDQD